MALKNEFTISGDTIHIQCPLTGYHITGSTAHYDLLTSYRWRIVRNTPITVSGSTVCTIDHMLYGTPVKDSLHRKDGNPLNVMPTNCAYSKPTTRQNRIVSEGETSYLFIEEYGPLIVDTDALPDLTTTYWRRRIYRGKSQIVGKVNGSLAQLARHLLAIGPREKGTVVHSNGDDTDFRLNNLEWEFTI